MLKYVNNKTVNITKFMQKIAYILTLCLIGVSIPLYVVVCFGDVLELGRGAENISILRR